MARTNYVAEDIVSAGLAGTKRASTADGHMFTVTGKEVLILENTTAGSVNVTLVTPATVDGLAVADRVVAVPATSRRVVGKLAKSTYARASDADPDPNKCYVDFGTVDAGVTVTYLTN